MPQPTQATVSMPAVRMQKSSEFYPKGKKWTFTGTNPSPAGALNVTGKPFVAGKSFGPQEGGSLEYRRMEGGLVLGGSGTVVVAPGVNCRTGAVYWSARRVGR